MKKALFLFAGVGGGALGSVDTGHSPVAAGLPDASGDAATHQSAIDETHCSNAERGTHGG